MNQEENLDFTTAGTGRFSHDQIWSKLTKLAEKLQKWDFLANLNVLSKNFDAELYFDRFSSHYDQKKLIFRSFQNFQDFTVVK